MCRSPLPARRAARATAGSKRARSSASGFAPAGSRQRSRTGPARSLRPAGRDRELDGPFRGCRCRMCRGSRSTRRITPGGRRGTPWTAICSPHRYARLVLLGYASDRARYVPRQGASPRCIGSFGKNRSSAAAAAGGRNRRTEPNAAALRAAMPPERDTSAVTACCQADRFSAEYGPASAETVTVPARPDSIRAAGLTGLTADLAAGQIAAEWPGVRVRGMRPGAVAPNSAGLAGCRAMVGR